MRGTCTSDRIVRRPACRVRETQQGRDPLAVASAEGNKFIRGFTGRGEAGTGFGQVQAGPWKEGARAPSRQTNIFLALAVMTDVLRTPVPSRLPDPSSWLDRPVQALPCLSDPSTAPSRPLPCQTAALPYTQRRFGGSVLTSGLSGVRGSPAAAHLAADSTLNVVTARFSPSPSPPPPARSLFDGSAAGSASFRNRNASGVRRRHHPRQRLCTGWRKATVKVAVVAQERALLQLMLCLYHIGRHDPQALLCHRSPVLRELRSWVAAASSRGLPLWQTVRRSAGQHGRPHASWCRPRRAIQPVKFFTDGRMSSRRARGHQ